MTKFFQAQVLTFVLLAAVAGLTACTRSSQDEQTVNLVQFENPKSLDPAQSLDAIASEVIGATYEPLLQYNYIERPYTLEPLLAAQMPEVSKDRKTVTVHIKQSVFFQDDPCFSGGKGRELTANDFIYAMKRVADPQVKSDGWYLLDGKIVGLNAWRDQASRKGHADYNAEVLGLLAPDSYTLVMKLISPYPQLNYALAMMYLAPVPHEALDKYGEDFGDHPVGTGPFMLKNYTRGVQLVFVKNPHFHGENFPQPSRLQTGDCKVGDKNSSMARASSPFAVCDQEKAAGASDNMDYGEPLPRADKVVVHIILERQPAWLEFMKGKLDMIRVPKDSVERAIGADHKLLPELAKKGMALSLDPSTTEWFLAFNMRDSILGKSKKLRQAIAAVFDSRREIELFTGGLAKVSNQILPPEIDGYEKNLPDKKVSLEKAQRLLTEAGFPNGRGLQPLPFDVESGSDQRQFGEYVKAQLAQIGIKVEVRTNTRPQLLDRQKQGTSMFFKAGWIADYPDAENFMQLLYGPNRAPGPNVTMFDNSEFNKLYEQLAAMSTGDARRAGLIHRMNQIFLDELPWVPDWTAVIPTVRQGWLKNFLYSDFSYNDYKYYHVDVKQKAELIKQL